ncbi:MAG: DNA polymerase III subunit gamma/tau, partial [Acidobacteria bacterium]|nr:DNA polymerase III subunit gamma/tau [Acidobacteriota bacterium]
RKYRPQRFDDIVGQRGVTQTLRNAIAAERVAQAFVFAGPRGVGKTTTARVLARALNCESGPTADPCGQCSPCTEIAEGRDIDVLEIDAATHTQVENVREVIIAGLAMAPVRNRYKIFIIDEFHQLSSHSFNALLKSIEEPPPHVVFMMATTELQKIPETILSRSQVFELRTIGTQAIGEQLRAIAAKESIAIDDAAVLLIARAADGSMRDAQSALDQVLAFAGDRITAEEVSTVLGLIGRDPVLDAVEVVADENAPAVFELAGRFVEAGYDLRLVCRELSRALRDMLVISIDASRAQDPDVATDADRDRLLALARRFSREDLMRAFDVLSRAEFEIRGAAQPPHHFEMALLKWMHLGKLVPLTELLAGGGARLEPSPARPQPRSAPPPSSPRPATASDNRARPAPAAAAGQAASPASRSSAPEPPPAAAEPPAEADGKAAILAEIKRRKKFFHGTVVAQAQRIELAGDRLVFTFAPAQRTLAEQVEQGRKWLEEIAAQVAGRKVAVVAERDGEDARAPAPAPPPAPPPAAAEDLKEGVLGDQVVQAMLDVLGAEIRDVEKMEP